MTPYGPGPPYMPRGYQRAFGRSALEDEPEGRAVRVAGTEAEAPGPGAARGGDLLVGRRPGLAQLQAEPPPVVGEAVLEASLDVNRSRPAGPSPPVPRGCRPGRRVRRGLRCPTPRPRPWPARRAAASPRGGGSSRRRRCRGAPSAGPRPPRRRTARWTGRPPGRSGGAPGRLGHGVRAGVDADDEGVRVGGSGGQDEPAVAGAQVDHDPGRAGPSMSELADVHLVDALADHGAHAATVRDLRRVRHDPAYTPSRCPSSRSARTSSCRRRSIRGTRGRRTSRATSPG